MLEALDKPSEGSWTNGTSSTPTVAEPSNGDVELELSHYVSRLGKMSVQLRQTSGQHRPREPAGLPAVEDQSMAAPLTGLPSASTTRTVSSAASSVPTAPD